MMRRLADQLSLQIPTRLRAPCEWLGSALGILGSLLMAANVEVSPFAWLFFLASNTLMLIFAALIRSGGLAVMQATFIGTSILGISRWLF